MSDSSVESRFSDPIAAFDTMLAALNTEDWHGIARLCDPLSLRVFQRQMLDQLTSRESIPMLTVEDMLRMSPEMPREAAEYQVAQFRKHVDPAARLHEDFPDVESLDALRALTAVETFAAWLDGRSIRRQVVGLVANGDLPPEAADLGPNALAHAPPYVAVGAVYDGERIAHVVFRHGLAADQEWTGDLAASLAQHPTEEAEFIREMSVRGHPRTVPCRRQPDGTWRLVAGVEFLSLGAIAFSDARRVDEMDPAPEGESP